MADRKHIQQDGHPTIFSLRIAAIASALTTVIVFAWAVREHQKLGIYADVDGTSLCGMIVATASYALAWSLVPLTVRLLLHRALHPGIYIAFDFIAFGAVLATTIVTMLLLIPAAEGGYPCRWGGSGVCRNHTLSNVEFFGYAIALLNSVLHCVQFVWACWACDRYRKQSREINV